jgi:DNA-binding NarL/FixJ family response regulator
MSLKIFIIEDHPVMRYTLSNFLRKTLHLEVCGAAATGAEALERLAEVEADLVLVDVLLPGMSGLELLYQLKERYPELLCLVLSGHGEELYIQHAFKAGARGYVLKGDPPELKKAIETVRGGGTYLSPALRAGQGPEPAGDADTYGNEKRER